MKSASNEGEGSDALIHLRVPMAVKARWVAQSRREGKKLTDWIVQKVEAKPMNIFKIPDTLADKYHGAGFVDLETDDASMAIFQASETSRGVPVHQLVERVQRLTKEAQMFQERNP